jgi:glyoxylase-like metal-dependent hydrolase (beta-lactamase superfamily II)
MTWLCQTCGVEYPPINDPPARCPICEDHRQWVPPSGQGWTTLEKLRQTHRNSWKIEEPGVWSIKSEPSFAIGQQAFLLHTPHGNVLWDCISLIDEATVEMIKALGGVKYIAISHPHYYSTMLQWSEAFGNVPVYIHEAEREWVQRNSPAVTFWTGDSHELLPGLTLVRSGGHFAGYQVLHWNKGAGGKGVLFAGDQPQVTMDRRWVSFLWSYPNMIPLGKPAIDAILASLDPLPYDRIYGAFGRHVMTGAKEVVQRSAERYLRFL